MKTYTRGEVVSCGGVGPYYYAADTDAEIAQLRQQLAEAEALLADTTLESKGWQRQFVDLRDRNRTLSQSLAQAEARVGELLDALKELSKECESVLDIHPGISQWSIRSALQTADLLLSKGEMKTYTRGEVVSCGGVGPYYYAADTDAEIAQLRQQLAEAQKDAGRYQWLRSQVRASFSEDVPDQPQLIYRKRSDPFIKGYAQRVDAACDAAMAGEGKGNK